MPNYENPKRRTSVNILKMDIPPFLSRELSKFDEIWYTNPNVGKAEEI